MKLLQIAEGKYVNPERITYIWAKSSDKVIVHFQMEPFPGSMGIPPSYLEIKGAEAARLMAWLSANSEHI